MAAAEAAAARFGLEARVECNCGTWEPGAVVGHDYTDERLDGQVCPYQVRLDDGRLFCVPLDDVSAPAPCPQSASCLLTSPMCVLAAGAGTGRWQSPVPAQLDRCAGDAGPHPFFAGHTRAWGACAWDA